MGQYIMWFETIEGDKIKAFNWDGKLEVGIKRVYAEANENGYKVKSVWGEEKEK